MRKHRCLAGLGYLPVHFANRPDLGRDPVFVLVHRHPGTQGGYVDGATYEYADRSRAAWYYCTRSR